MVHSYGQDSVEKVTFNISSSLKEQVIELKDELQVSLSTIYNEAIANYLKQKELEKWHRGVAMALDDEEYLKEQTYE
jgi:predicted transcriptional regulator